MNEQISGKTSVETNIENSGNNVEEVLSELSKREKSQELAGLAEWSGIKERYRAEMIRRSIQKGNNLTELPKDLKAEMDEEFKKIDEKYTVNGVHFLRCQFSEIIKSLIQKLRVEYEAFGPYLRDYFKHMFQNSVDGIKLEKQDEIGLAIMKYLKDFMPEARAVSLYDEYNLGITAALPSGSPMDRDYTPNKYQIYYTHDNGLPGSEKLSAKLPKKKSRGNKENPPVGLTYVDRGRLYNESEALKNEFRNFVYKILESRGIVKANEIEGRNQDYTLISETQKVEDAINLAKLLKEKGLLEGDPSSETGEIWFQNTIENCDDPRYLRIKLRSEDGHWECPALDASGFLDESNRNITHLIVLPQENFEDQQDKVWEILHSIGFQPRNYHNIFIDVDDPDVTTDSVVNTIKNKIGIHPPNTSPEKS